MVNLGAIAKMVHICRATGGNPAELHLSKNTLDEIKAVVKANAKPTPDTRSMLDRMRGAPIPGAIPNGVYLVASLPAIENEEVQDGHAVIRPMEAMADPEWLQKFYKRPEVAAELAQAQQAAAQAGDTPWIVKQKSDPSDPDKVSVSSLTQGRDGLPTPSEVLMFALENVEKYSDIIVVKVTKSGDVFLAASMHQPAAVGYLQKVFHKLL